jgi:hypothetical protein
MEMSRIMWKEFQDIPNSVESAYICFANAIGTTSHNSCSSSEDGCIDTNGAVDRASTLVNLHVDSENDTSR